MRVGNFEAPATGGRETRIVALLCTGATITVLGVLVDIARVAGAEFRGAFVTHVTTGIGSLVVAWALSLGGAGRDGQLRRLRRSGYLLIGILLSSIAIDLTLPARSTTHWLSGPHAGVALAVAGLLLVVWRAIDTVPRSHVHRSPHWRHLVGPYVLALLLVMVALVGTDYLGRPNLWRDPAFHLLSSAVFPILLCAAAARRDRHWAATSSALWYTLIAWGAPSVILLLSSTTDQALTLVAPPILLGLLLPAVATDAIARVLDRPSARALWAGLAFVGLFVVPHWVAAPTVLESSWAADLYPALDHWPVGREPPWPDRLWIVMPGRRADFAALVGAGVVATISAYTGFWIAHAVDGRERGEAAGE